MPYLPYEKSGVGTKNILSSLLMTKKDYDLFKIYARKKDWSLGKLFRVSTTALIYMEEKKLGLEEALEKALERENLSKLK